MSEKGLQKLLKPKNKPIFVDIDEKDFNINVDKIEEKITPNTKAILAVHCFGYPCDVERIEQIAQKYNLYVIYDAAHCFGAKLNGKSMLSYGDISSCSLHATKIFHSVEGGLCVVNNEKFNEKMNAIKNFGNNNGNYDSILNSVHDKIIGISLLIEILNDRKLKTCLSSNSKSNFLNFSTVSS